MEEDTFKTISKISEGIYKEKGSKFISFAIPVNTEEEAKQHINDLKKNYHDARHHCYAYVLGGNKSFYRINDDGEPSGTAGKPIYGQILHFDLTNILIVVVRYFGGTKLGASGLLNAYRESAKDGLAKADIITKTIDDVVEIFFNYESTNEIMKIIKNSKAKKLSQNFGSVCQIIFSIRKNHAENLLQELSKINSLKIKQL